MKKVLVFFLTLVLAISLISCGNNEDPDDGGNKPPDTGFSNGAGGIDTPIIDIT